jgi:hypothetical protein
MNPLAFVEGRMSLHMLLEFPLLLALGWWLARWVPRRTVAFVDAHGLLGATAASCVFAFWMIPASLDLALQSPAFAAGKYLGWIAAGVLLGVGYHRLSPVVAFFFLGNAAWMLATAGLLYRDTETRLCVNYLTDDQRVTGTGLVVWALALGALAAWRLRPLLREASAPTAKPPGVRPQP